MKKGLLPIGTVVILEGGTKKVMITGYYSKAEGENKIYQYNGCIFPEGFMENVFCLFDQSQIVEVFYKGLENDEYESYINEMDSRTELKYTSVPGAKTKNEKSNNVPKIKPKAPTRPRSASEMKSKYGIQKVSGQEIKRLH